MFTPSTALKGTTDIHALVNGRHLSIEVVLLMAYVRFSSSMKFLMKKRQMRGKRF
jgi:hypothetical protein